MKTNMTSDMSHGQNMHKVALILFISGLVMVFAHFIFLQEQQVPGDDNWLISFDVTYTTQQPDSVLSIQPPYESENLRLVGRALNHPGLSVVQSSQNALNKRAIRLRSREPGTYHASVEFTVQVNQNPHFHNDVNKSLSTKWRQIYLADDEWLQLDNLQLEVLLTDIGFDKLSLDKLPDNIFSHIQRLPGNNSSTARMVHDILGARSVSYQEKVLLMVALCRKAGIPARMVTGLELKESESVNSVYWVEAYVNDKWRSYFPGPGYISELPNNLVAMDKYGDGIVSILNIKSKIRVRNYDLDNDIAIERVPDRLISPDNTRNEWYQVFILDRLPVDTREQLSLLMLLPLGALLCSFIRQFAGLHSYGVFTPTILALAITYADKETTFLILMITLLVVYFARPAFHHEMSRTPRLSIIFTLVAVSMVLGVSILDHFSPVTDGMLILLPIVIITSLVDRFFSAVDLLGYRTAIVRLTWTIILTLVVLPVLQLNWLGGWLLRYPESHLLTLSLLILISSYPFGKHKLPVSLGWLIEPKKKNKTDGVVDGS